MDLIFQIALCLTFVCGLIAWGCQIYVVRTLRKDGQQAGNIFVSFLVPLIQGWRFAGKLQIVDVMAFWSLMLAITFISGAVVIVNVIARAPSTAP